MHHYVVDDRLENLLGALAVAVSDSLSRAVQKAAGHPGALGAALAVLSQEAGLGIEQLRRPLSRSQSATVRIVDQLVADGYAQRTDGRDHRSVAVVLTEKGTTAAAQVRDSRRDVLRDALAALDAGERTVLTVVLEKILAAITTDLLHAEQICRLCDLGACPLEACPVELAGRREPRPIIRPEPVPLPDRYQSQ